MKTIKLIIEKGLKGTLDGRAVLKDGVVIHQGLNEQALISSMKRSIEWAHGIDAGSIKFEISYDLTAFFSVKHYLNLTEVAKAAGINANLLRQYSRGEKQPSPKRIKEIQAIVNNIGRELAKTRFV